jgi:hypothetical protein
MKAFPDRFRGCRWRLQVGRAAIASQLSTKNVLAGRGPHTNNLETERFGQELENPDRRASELISEPVKVAHNTDGSVFTGTYIFD